MFTNEKVTVNRLVNISNIQSFQTIYENVDIFIEPVGKDDLLHSIEVKVFRGILETNIKDYIKTGDSLIGEDGQTYEVNTSSFFRGPVKNTLELILVINK